MRNQISLYGKVFDDINDLFENTINRCVSRIEDEKRRHEQNDDYELEDDIENNIEEQKKNDSQKSESSLSVSRHDVINHLSKGLMLSRGEESYSDKNSEEPIE